MNEQHDTRVRMHVRVRVYVNILCERMKSSGCLRRGFGAQMRHRTCWEQLCVTLHALWKHTHTQWQCIMLKTFQLSVPVSQLILQQKGAPPLPAASKILNCYHKALKDVSFHRTLKIG